MQIPSSIGADEAELWLGKVSFFFGWIESPLYVPSVGDIHPNLQIFDKTTRRETLLYIPVHRLLPRCSLPHFSFWRSTGKSLWKGLARALNRIGLRDVSNHAFGLKEGLLY